MATSNARIQFSTADEKTWKYINPMLREGELVITKKPSGKYRLYVGGTGGSKFNDSILVWDEEEAENLANKAASNANLAESHATSAGMSANAAETSEINARSSEQAAAASAATVSYATQEEVNLGIESRKIVSPKTLETLLNLLQRNTSYKVGDIVYSSKLPSWAYLECTQAGTTAATEPNLSTISGIEVNDGSAKFRIVDKRMKARATGIVNKKFLWDIGFVTHHIGTVVAEIVGYTEEGYRRVKFTVQCSCIDTGTNTTEFRWLNFYNNSIGIATAYFDKYPESKFVKHELLTYPMMYCDVLTKEEKGYGAYVELSGGFVNLSRMYTADGKIGMYPNSMLKTGSCMFEFISDFTNE